MDTPPPDAPPPLRFDTPAAPDTACGFCRRPLDRTYYTVNGRVACPACRDAVSRHLRQPAGLAGVATAIGLGSAAGMVGALVWWAIRRFASLEIGIIAIAIGHLVGLGVRRGSGGRGGRGYQVLAVALTYVWITANYVPDIVLLLMSSPPAVTAAASDDDRLAPFSPEPASPDGTASPGVGRQVLTFVMLFGIAMAAPFLQGAGNILGILIISFGLWQAWTLNTPATADIAGPYSLQRPGAPANA